MIIDASVLVAILLSEADADQFIDCLDSNIEPVFASPVTIFECVAALMRSTGCSVAQARAATASLLDEYKIEVADISADIGDQAIIAFDRFGKGRHPASLNMGDCFSFGLAKARRLPMLFKGNYFGKTDIDCVIKK